MWEFDYNAWGFSLILNLSFFWSNQTTTKQRHVFFWKYFVCLSLSRPLWVQRRALLQSCPWLVDWLKRIMGHFWTIQERHCLGNLMYHGNKKKGYKGSETNGSSAQLTWTPLLVTHTLTKCSFIIDEQLVTRFKYSAITSRGAVFYPLQLCLSLHKQCMQAILQSYIYMRFRMTENGFSALVILLYRNSKCHFDMLLFDRFNCSYIEKMIKGSCGSLPSTNRHKWFS